MANPGQAVFAIGGAAIGFVLGGPQGALYGFQAGLTAGSLLFPGSLPGREGPRIDDLSIQTSTYGAAIPIIYGSFRLAGNIIWARPITEVSTTTTQGGKGGPSVDTTVYTYFDSYAVGLCEGEIQGIRRIWANGAVVYDIRERQEGETESDFNARIAQSETFAAYFTVHTGTETQDRDALIESFEPDTPAFRGLAYIVFEELPLADYGNRLPNLEFELSAAAHTTVSVSHAPENLYPWIDGTSDPRNPFNSHEYRYGTSGPWGSFAAAIAAAEADFGFPITTAPHGWSPATQSRISAIDSFTIEDDVVRRLRFTDARVPSAPNQYSRAQISAAGGNPDLNPGFNTLFALGASQQEFAYVSSRIALSYGGYIYMTQDISDDPPFETAWAGLNNCIPSFGCPYPGGSLYGLPDVLINVRRKVSAPQDPCSGEQPFGDNFCVIDGLVVKEKDYVLEFGDFKWLSVYETDGNNVIRYPLGPALRSDHPSYSDETFWATFYLTAVAAGELPAGLTYSETGGGGANTYPRFEEYAYREAADFTFTEQISVGLSEIISDLCERAGLESSQVDVTALEGAVARGTITGYGVTRTALVRDAIAPLRNILPFDVAETDGVLRFVPRGDDPVVTLTEDDLAAHEGDGQRPSAYGIRRVQEAELPLQVRVKYQRAEESYEVGEQSAQRIVTRATNRADIEVPAALTDQQAADMSQILLFSPWAERQSVPLSLAPKWFVLDPGDVVTLPIDGVTRRLRIETTDSAMTGPVSVRAVQEDAESYALTGSPGEAGTLPGGIIVIGPVRAVLLDIPSFRLADNDSGIYVAVYATFGSFRGAAVLRSTDSGTTYETVGSTAFSSRVGTLDEALPAGPSSVIDNGNVLSVTLATGALESITTAALYQGGNFAAIGADGRWEIIQFTEADQQSDGSWLLSGLTRGRRGTEHLIGTSEAGDTFVLLDNAVLKIPPKAVDVGRTHLYKAVASGSSPDAVKADSITIEGEILSAFSPGFVQGQMIEGDLVMTWLRRDRALVTELPGYGGDMPLTDAPEAYVVEVLDGSTVVRTLICSVETVTYTAAQIAADFGSPPSNFTVRIAQRNSLGIAGPTTTAILPRAL